MDDRSKYMGASDAPTLMTGDDAAILDLWKRKTRRIPEPDLTDPAQCDNWFQVRLGKVTEQWNLEARRIASPEVLPLRIHDDTPIPLAGKPHIIARPDAFILDGNGVMDAKHTNPYPGAFTNKEERVYKTYYWQLQQQTLCTGTMIGAISPIYGNIFGDVISVNADGFEQQRLLERIEWFWHHVKNDTPPVDIPPPAEPVMPTEYRTIKLSETNFGPELEAHAKIWIATVQAKQDWGKADGAIKELIPQDVNRAEGYGIVVTRSKPSKTRPNGSLKIEATA